MRRISLALALVGAMAAAGCGAGTTGSGSTGKAPGVAEGTFKVTIQNGQAGAALKIAGGFVTSNPAGISCGVSAAGADLNACEAEFPIGSTVTLTPTGVNGKIFLQWAGDCQGTSVCAFDGGADKYLIASFGTSYVEQGVHPNWSDPALHGPETIKALTGGAGGIPCASCHGASLQGMGIAVSCQNCHAPAATVKAETCATCHPAQGAAHQAKFNRIWDAPKLVATLGTVTYDAGTVTVNYSLTKNGQPYTVPVAQLAQKTVYVAKFDRAARKFTAYKSLTSAAGTGAGNYVATGTGVAFDPTTTDSFVYAYFAENPTVLPFEPSGHYRLYDDVASVAKQFKATAEATDWSYVTATPSKNCEKCHPAPYMKHGYRAGAVAGVQDIVACKACHADNRVGSHPDWQVLVTDPARYVRIGATPPEPLTPAELATYAYNASVMNDTHMSHAMEFAYPQSMANCVTCHENPAAPGTLMNNFLTDANFTLATCKSCHPVTATTLNAKRAPPLYGTGGVMPGYHDLDANGKVSGHECNECHTDKLKSYAAGVIEYWTETDPEYSDGIPAMAYGHPVKLFNQVHNGYDHRVYTAAGAKYAETIKASITSTSFDPATNKVTVDFTVSGAAAGALIKPTVVMSLYGYDTKDFIVGGHASQPAPDGKRNLEWAEGASGNSPRLAVTPAVATAGNTTWTAVADLSLWSAYIADGRVKRGEIGILPVIGADNTVAVSDTNPEIAVAGVSKTIALPAGTIVEDAAAYGRNITDTAKCNKCHEALAIEFHHPAYGSAGVVGCRLCHVVGNGGSHLEMQSRSIDSYVHALHSMQVMDVNGINFADPVAAMKYDHHIGSTYPKFSSLDCESCHNAGTYEVPANDKSLPGILSASSAITGKTRAINGVPSVVTGPGARACGSCHRSEAIKADDADALRAIDNHTKAFGYREVPVAPQTIAEKLLQVIDAVF
jgi:OmcA/MtrC family decaheme c-type cytochrome